MKAMLLEMLTSKKAIAAVVSALVYGLGRLHFNADPSAMLGVVTPLWLYIVGQALADHGKAAAQIQATTAAAALVAAGAAPAPKAAP